VNVTSSWAVQQSKVAIARAQKNSSQTLVEELGLALALIDRSVLDQSDKGLLIRAKIQAKAALENGMNAMPDDNQIQDLYQRNSELRKFTISEYREVLKEEIRREAEERGGFTSLADQNRIVKELIREYRMIPQLAQAYNLAAFVRYGSSALVSENGFPNVFEITPELTAQAITKIGTLRKQAALKIEKLKANWVGGYLSHLSEPQTQLLSQRLGIVANDVPKLYGGTSRKKIRQVFTVFAMPLHASISPSELEDLNEKIAKRAAKFSDLDILVSEYMEFISSFPSGTFSEHQLKNLTAALSSDSSRYANEINRLEKLLSPTSFSPEFGMLRVRYHVESIPADGLWEINDSIRKLFAEATARRNSIPFCNFIEVRGLESLFELFECPLVADQHAELNRFGQEWLAKLEKVSSIEEYVEVNNESLEGLSELLLHEQSRLIYQFFVAINGLHQFLQRPDVMDEFEMTEDQLLAMNVYVNDNLGKLDREIDEAVEDAVRSEISILEKSFSMPCAKLFGIEKFDLAKEIGAMIEPRTLNSRLDADRSFFREDKLEFGQAENSSFFRGK
jgi:hypothetical protein